MRALKSASAAMVAAAVLAGFAPAGAAQRKDCGDLKGEIDARIKQNGVAVFSLEIVDAGAPPSGKVVGTCEGGQKIIVYKRGG